MITDFKHLKPGNAFPTSHEDNIRIARYKLNGDRFTGDYAKNKLDDEKNSKSLKVTVGKAVIEVTPGFDHDTLKSLVGILSQC